MKDKPSLFVNIAKTMAGKENNIYLLSAIFLFLGSVFSVGYYHFDEHFQILEFAGLKLGLTTAENLPWEYHSQIRPSIQPLIVFCLSKILSTAGTPNPFTTAFLLRLISAALSFTGIWLLYNVYKSRINDKILQKWFLLLSFLLWFLIMISVRFSSESWSGTSFIIAFASFLSVKRHNALSSLFIGLILGFSFIVRYQSGFLVFGFLAWIIILRKEKPFNILILALAIVLVFLLGILSDRWFYGEWTLTSWNYFETNILQDKISEFGLKPWHYYIDSFFIQGIPPFSLLFILSIIIFIIFKSKSPVTWSILPFLIIHFIIGHKEMRFLFPIAGFLPVITVKAIEAVQVKFLRDLSVNRYMQFFMRILFAANFIALMIITFKPADQQVCLYRKVYKDYKDPVTLYYIDQNPYLRGMNINFYKSMNLDIRQIDSPDSIQNNIPDRTELIVFSSYSEHFESEGQYKLIYSSFPKWIVKFNFNNWLSRSNAWNVYELDQDFSLQGIVK